MLYELKSANNFYDVVETSTGQVIASFSSRASAKHLCKEMNSGKGFDGFTPEFFLQTFNLPKEEAYICSS